jgi:N-acetylmuramoyl-L-alanine amidase
MTPATSTPTTAPPSPRPPGPPGPPGPRLQLDPTMAGTGAVDGGWWPRSRDPDAELPGLIASLDASLGPITRIALNPDAWDTTPRRVAVDGRRVRVGWFRHMDTHTIGVTRTAQDRTTLLVVPPQATTTAAQIAMATAADAANSTGPADILAAAGLGGQDPGPISPQRHL